MGGGGRGGMDDVQMMLSLYSSNEESDGDGLDLSLVVHYSSIKKQQRCLEGCSIYHIISGWLPFLRCYYIVLRIVHRDH